MGRRGLAMPGLLAALALVSLSLFAVRTAGCGTSEAGLPVITVDVAGHKAKAEVAATEAQRARGLMYRRKMAKNAGMLFVYPREEPLSFWMKNTYLPLSIAYIDRDRRIVHITDMQPLTTKSHPSKKPAQFALEMNQGWFEERGVKVGDVITFELPEGLVIGGR